MSGADKAGGACCPKCGEAFSPEFVFDATKDSRMSFKLHPGEGGHMMADTVGGAVQNLAKLIAAVGRQNGHRSVLLVERIGTDADGALCFDFICARATAPKRKRRAAADKE
jgi:hypothetical protein